MTTTATHRDIVLAHESIGWYWTCETCGKSGKRRVYGPDASADGHAHARLCADDPNVTVTVFSPDDSPEESV